MAKECEPEPIKNILLFQDYVFFVVGDSHVLKCQISDLSKKQILTFQNYQHYIQICTNIFTWLDINENQQPEMFFCYFPTKDTEKLG